MPAVLKWSPTVDPSEFVLQVREALAAGLLVALPGDVGYFVLANPAADATEGHLRTLAGIADATPCFLSYGPEDAPCELPTIARRLMLRAWPAPLVVAVGTAHGELRFRCPEHLVTEAVYPAVHANGRLAPTLVIETFLPTVEAVIERLGDAVGLAVSAGPLPVGRLTVVRADEASWSLLQEGDFEADEIQRLAARIVLFVCTGNTCRSPLAEGLARKLLADRLGCAQEELPARGYWMLSAGVAAYGGGPASQESADVASEFGADLLGHRSRPVNPQLLAAADDVIAMTRSHAYAIAVGFPGVGPPPRLLCDNDDLDDPIGASLDVYRDCAKTILKHLERLLPEWVGT